MESGESYIKNMCGKGRPFSVPQGYFDDFSERIMSQLPHEEVKVVKLSVWQRYRSAVAVAACLCVMLVGGAVYMSVNSRHDNVALGGNAVHESASYSSADYAADYSMLDNDDIYALVSNY